MAQLGGEKTITQGTLDQCLAAQDRMGFQLKPGPVEGEYVLSLLLRELPQDDTDAPDMTIPTRPVVAPIVPEVAPIVITG